MFSSILAKILLSVLFGAAIGLERESSNQGPTTLGGIRTYSLFCLLGAIAGIFYINNILPLAVIIVSSILLLVAIYYAIGSFFTKDFGLTTELSVVVTFLIGLLLVLDIIPLQIIVVIFVLLALILSLKSKTQKLMAGVSANEVQSFISYAIIALVVLPFLPDVGYKLADLPILPTIFDSLNIGLGKFSTLELINPQKIWLVVVLITGIDVLGYVLSRFVGQKKSFMLTSFFGGFVSSTSTTQSLAQKSNKMGVADHLVGAAIIANLASFVQLFLLIGPLNARWLISVIPSLLIMILTAGFLAFYFLRKKGKNVKDDKEETKDKKIFSLLPALKFAGLLIIIKLFTKICLILFGKSGFIFSSVIASLVGLDAIVVTLAEMAGSAITYKFALFVLLLVNGTNLLSKSVFSYLQGTRKFALRFFVSAIIIILFSFSWLLFI
ncbi:MAG TPA: hypothetical protein DEB09_00535 [Candidatus Magasanikbacteria bacterium]|nr:hypothetical protein [Candidatus Magasanikbacteria bacterium]